MNLKIFLLCAVLSFWRRISAQIDENAIVTINAVDPWHDDFVNNTNMETGWWKHDGTDATISSVLGFPTLTSGDNNTYHRFTRTGTTASTRHQYMVRYFICEENSWLSVDFKLAVCGTNNADHFRLYSVVHEGTSFVGGNFQEVLLNEPSTAMPDDGTMSPFANSENCDSWSDFLYDSYNLNGSLFADGQEKHVLMKKGGPWAITFKFKFSSDSEFAFLWDIALRCNEVVVPTEQPTPEPTQEPTISPTGNPTAVPSMDPTAAPTTITHFKIALNAYHTCQVWDDGVKCWGRNDVCDPEYAGGAIEYIVLPPIDDFDLGTADGALIPYEVRCGLEHTCVFSVGGAARCWGQNDHGQLGYGNTDYFSDGDNFGKDVDLGAGVLVLEWSAGDYFNCILTTDYVIICFGRNEHGQLGVGHTNSIGDGNNEMGNSLDEIDFGTFEPRVVAVGAGHGCAIDDVHTVKCWGDNTYGQLGYEDTNNRGDESDEMGDNLITVDLGANFFAHRLELGDCFTCVISTAMTMKCFGCNDYGQLGQGHSDHLGDDADEMGDNLPVIDLGASWILNDVKCSVGFICVSNDLGQIKCWGLNNYGQLGYEDTVNRGDGPNEMGDHLEVVDLGTDFLCSTTALPSGGGGDHSVVVSDDLDVKAWGNNDHGQCGNGEMGENDGDDPNEMGDYLPIIDTNREPTALPTAVPTAVPSNYPSTVPTIMPSNNPSAVPTGVPTATPTTITQFQICLNTYHMCQVWEDGVKCWGKMDVCDPSYNGSAIEYILIPQIDDFDLGATDGAIVPFAVRCGLEHVCVFSEEGKGRCWGQNEYGQLGYENTDYFSDPDNFGKDVDLGTGVLVLEWSAGDYFNCILTTNYDVVCYGRNDHGQIGIGNTIPIGDGPSEMGTNLIFVDLGAFLPRQLAVGSAHGCCIDNQFAVKCWGENTYGQLGYGDTDDRGDNAGEMGDDLHTVDLGADFEAHRLCVGNQFTCVISTAMTIKCFGRNDYGQLGQGHPNHLGDEPDEMGDNLPVIDLGSSWVLNDAKCSNGFVVSTSWTHSTCSLNTDTTSESASRSQRTTTPRRRVCASTTTKSPPASNWSHCSVSIPFPRSNSPRPLCPILGTESTANPESVPTEGRRSTARWRKETVRW